MWSLEMGCLYKDWGKLHSDKILSMAVTSDNLAFYTGGFDKCLKKWSFENLENYNEQIGESELQDLLLFDFGKVHKMSINFMVLTENNKYLFTVGTEKTLKKWCVNQNLLLKDFKKIHDKKVNSLISCSNSKYLFSGSDDMSIKQWNIESNVLIRVIANAHDEAIRKIVISPDDRFLVSIGDDNSLKQWSVDEFKLQKDYGDASSNPIASIVVIL